MFKVTIEPIDPSLWRDEIDRVFKSAYKVEAKLLGVDMFPPLNRSPEDLVLCGNRFVGALEGSELCGAMEVAGPEQATDPIAIVSLAVAPKYFRCGIGRELVKSVFNDRGTASIRLTTGLKNAPAIGLYHELGFTESGRFTTPDGVEMVEFTWG